MRGLCDEGKVKEAISLRDEMESLRVMPNEVTYNTLIDGCFQWRGCVESFKLVEEMKGKGVKTNAMTHNIMVKWYCKEGKMDEAGCVVAKMVGSGFLPDCFTYNTMINGYCKAGNLGEAFRMMDEMGRKGLKMDTFTLNTIVHKLCTEKMLKEAYELTVKAAKRGYILDEVTYGTLIMGYFKNEQTNKALKLWDEMKEKRIIPSGAVEKAFLFYNRMVENSFKPDVIICNILLRGLCKHGMFENTWIIKGRYNTLISVLCKEGKLDEAFDLMTEMEKKKLGPDRYTYIAFIGALTHAGRTEEANKFMSKLLETGPNMISEDTSQILGAGDKDYSEQISNFCTQGKYKEAMKLFQESEQKGVSLNKSACFKLMDGLLKRRKSISKASLSD
ncbi:Pentatricopeptide repeat-containing protein [Arachis hypogaea]|nr:Pentatricopeptide repeat-containing protein [Arachis hypogaea]